MPARVITVAIYQEASHWALPADHVDQLREAFPNDQIHQATTTAELLTLLGETTHLVGLPLTPDQLDAAPNLAFVQLTDSIGDATPTLNALLKRNPTVIGGGEIRAPQIAEHALALTLGCTRRLDLSAVAQASHEWRAPRIAPLVRTLDGMNALVIGSGAVANLIGQRLAAFGVKPTLASPSLTAAAPPFIASTTIADLAGALPTADLAVLCAPRSADNPVILTKKLIPKLPAHAFIVDVSRGGLIDQHALLEALRRGRLAGAGLDAFEVEPLPATSSLWTMSNVIVTPHIAPASNRYWEVAMRIVTNNLRRDAANEPIPETLERPAATAKA